ncbi:Ubiquitin fusion degradation protein 1 [Fusarium oxysporum f. sp. albedinis]|nr:Ubiquitin fusion degradation protein 1 [Fusarium oxysporum f. sp. albedinis]
MFVLMVRIDCLHWDWVRQAPSRRDRAGVHCMNKQEMTSYDKDTSASMQEFSVPKVGNVLLTYTLVQSREAILTGNPHQEEKSTQERGDSTQIQPTLTPVSIDFVLLLRFALHRETVDFLSYTSIHSPVLEVYS